MITKGDMMESMLVACPSFRPAWDELVNEWATADDKPLYLALASLARHLATLFAARRQLELSRAFAVVERWHVEGDPYVREAATIGLLENLQNENLHPTTLPRDFEPLLLPESLKWWRKVEAFWRDGTLITE